MDMALVAALEVVVVAVAVEAEAADIVVLGTDMAADKYLSDLVVDKRNQTMVVVGNMAVVAVVAAAVAVVAVFVVGVVELLVTVFVAVALV
jgi:hypothetical protein